MKVTDIMQSVAALAASAPVKKAAKKKPSAAVAAHAVTDTATTLTADELLVMTASRIVAAFDLTAKGVTVDAVVAGVKAYERPYQGVVQ